MRLQEHHGHTRAEEVCDCICSCFSRRQRGRAGCYAGAFSGQHFMGTHAMRMRWHSSQAQMATWLHHAHLLGVFLQARALGVAAATAGVAYSTTAMPAQGAHFLHLITYAIWLVSVCDASTARQLDMFMCGVHAAVLTWVVCSSSWLPWVVCTQFMMCNLLTCYRLLQEHRHTYSTLHSKKPRHSVQQIMVILMSQLYCAGMQLNRPS